MAAAQNLEILIRTRGDTSGLAAVGSAIKQHFTEWQAFNARIFKGTEAIKLVLEQVTALFALGELRKYAGDAEKAAIAQEKLSQALFNASLDSKKFREELDAQAKSLQALTGVDDDVVTAVQAMLIGYGATANTIKDLTQATIDLAEFQGGDALGAAQMVGRGLVGDQIALRGFRVEIDKTLPKVEQQRRLFEILNYHVGGQAEAANRATGGLRGLRTELANIGEDAGKLVNTFATPFLKGFVEGLRDLVEKLKALEVQSPGTIANLRAIAESLGQGAAKIAPFVVGLVALGAVTKLLSIPLRIVLSLLNLFGVTAFLGWARSVITALPGIITGFTGGSVAVTLFSRALGLLSLTALLKEIIDTGLAIGNWVANLKVYGESIKVILANAFLRAWLEAKFVTLIKLKEISLEISTWAADQATLINKIVPRSAQIDVRGIEHFGTRAAADIGNLKAERERQLSSLEDIIAGNEEPLTVEVAPQATVPKRGPRPPPPPPPGDKTKGVEAADLAAAATRRLQGAEQQYQIEVQRTQLLQEGGWISVRDAQLQSNAAAAAYIENLHKIQADLPGIIAQLQAMAATEKDAGKKLKILDDIEALKRGLQEVTNKILEAQNTIARTTFIGQLRSQFAELEKQMGTAAENMAKAITTTLGTAISGVSSAISGVIWQTKTWRQAGVETFKAITDELIQLTVQTVAHYAIAGAKRLAYFITGQALKASDAATTVSTEETKAAATAPSALLQSISTYGVAALIGAAAFAAAMALAGGFAQGGIIRMGSGPKADDVMIKVSKGEAVLNARATSRLGEQWINAVNAGATPPTPITSESGYMDGGTVGGGSTQRSGRASNVFVVMDQRELRKLILQHPDADNHIVHVGRRRGAEIGRRA